MSEEAQGEVIGQLSETESQEFSALRAQSDAVLRRIGSLEVEKIRLAGQVGALENRAQQMAASITERLGLEKGQGWAADNDGNIRLK
jgi:hypothetical protein